MVNPRGWTDKTMGANMDKLMDQYVAGENRPVTHIHMAGNTGVIDQNTVVTNNAIMTNVHIGHQ